MKVEVLPTERALIGYLLAKIHKVDPDLIVVSTSYCLVQFLKLSRDVRKPTIWDIGKVRHKPACKVAENS